MAWSMQWYGCGAIAAETGDMTMTRIHIIHPAHIWDHMQIHAPGLRWRVTMDPKDPNGTVAAAVRGMDPEDRAAGCVVLVVDGRA